MENIKTNLKFKVFIWLSALMLVISGTGYYTQSIVNADSIVYVTRTGSKYHTHKCGNGTYYADSLSDALARGLSACSKCYGSSYSYDDYDYSDDYSYEYIEEETEPIKINKSSVILVNGKSTNLKISNATEKIKWSSDNKSVATVSSSGKVVAKKKGKTVITATVGDEKKTCKVTVEAPKLTKNKLSMDLKQTRTIKLKGCKHAVKWSTNKAAVVKVKKGKITAKDAGTAKVTATVHGKKFTCKVTVKKPKVESVVLSTTAIQTGYEDEERINIRTVPKNAINYYNISVKSSDRSIVVPSIEDGELKLENCNKQGKADITVTIGGVSTKCQVEVVPCVINELSLSEKEVALLPDETKSIYYSVGPYYAPDYYDAVWVSANESVVKVTEGTGVYSKYVYLEAVGEGETDVTLTLGNKSVTCHVVVSKPLVTELSLSEKEVALLPDETKSIYYSVGPYYAPDYHDAVWVSANESVVKVTEGTGVYSKYVYLEAVGEGETDVTLTLGNKSVVCHVVVG